jgi:hypothetical protein
LTGAVKTSPSGMLWRPPQAIAFRPLSEKRRSVPGPVMWTSRASSISFFSAFIAGISAVVEQADAEVEILERLVLMPACWAIEGSASAARTSGSG